MTQLQLRMAQVAVVAGYLFSGSLSQAQITWEVTYQDDLVNMGVGNGIGFNDATFGAARQATFQSVLNYINTVVDHNGTVQLNVQESETDGTGFLAAAGSLHFATDGFSSGLVFQHATTGVDPAAGNPDGSVVFDFGYIWNSETDATAAGEFDMFSVALHEVTHAMGFASLISSDGSGRLNEPAGLDTYTTFDSFLVDGGGTDLFTVTGPPPDVNFDNTQLGELTGGDLFFNGANAMAANGGNPVEIFAPAAFVNGSSISHLDLVTHAGLIMTPSIGAGQERRTYSAIEMGVLGDLGWTLSAVPEPSSFFLLLGATFVGASVRRRRRMAV